jgi:tetratricopeptide (TPR) repeat protein
MLKPRKRITKREIREDKLVTSYFEATDWFTRHKRLVTGALTTLVVIVVGAVVVSNNIRASNTRATEEVGRVLRYYDEGKFAEAINGVPQENIRGLLAVVEDFGSTKAGERAKLYLANAYFAIGDYENALKYYQSASLKDKMLHASAIAGAAACYEAKGDHANAASNFERAAGVGKDVVLAPEYLHLAAVNYAAAGQKDKAVALLQRVKKDFPNSSAAREADRFIAAFRT